MKVFISYSTAVDQIIALRIQTMAAVYGIESYVPPATTRYLMNGQLPPGVQRALKESEVVLAVITHAPAPSAIEEMRESRGKVLIPIVSPGVPAQAYAQFPEVFVVDPSNPSDVERRIVDYLSKKQSSEATRNALVALSALAVAVLLLGSLASEKA